MRKQKGLVLLGESASALVLEPLLHTREHGKERAQALELRRRLNSDPFSALRGIHLELRGTGSGAQRGRIGPGE